MEERMEEILEYRVNEEANVWATSCHLGTIRTKSSGSVLGTWGGSWGLHSLL